MNVGTYITLIVAAIVLLTMPVFAVVSRTRPMDADVARRPTTFLLGYWVRDWLMWLISPLERRFVAWELSPDLFNYLGGALGLAAGIAYATGDLDLGDQRFDEGFALVVAARNDDFADVIGDLA